MRASPSIRLAVCHRLSLTPALSPPGEGVTFPAPCLCGAPRHYGYSVVANPRCFSISKT